MTTSDDHTRTAEELEYELQNLELVKEMREKLDPSDDGRGWYETRPASQSLSPHSLMATTLRSPNLIAIPPLAFVKNDESEALLIYHLGQDLCGHEGIVHGGVIATILDDSLARNAFLSLPSKTGVTASLNISYLKPTKTDQFIVVRTKLDSIEGRKATVTGQIEDLSGQVLAKASGLFIEPRNAQVLSKSQLLAIWGERPATPKPPTGSINGNDGEKGNPEEPVV